MPQQVCEFCGAPIVRSHNPFTTHCSNCGQVISGAKPPSNSSQATTKNKTRTIKYILAIGLTLLFLLVVIRINFPEEGETQSLHRPAVAAKFSPKVKTDPFPSTTLLYNAPKKGNSTKGLEIGALYKTLKPLKAFYFIAGSHSSALYPGAYIRVARKEVHGSSTHYEIAYSDGLTTFTRWIPDSSDYVESLQRVSSKEEEQLIGQTRQYQDQYAQYLDDYDKVQLYISDSLDCYDKERSILERSLESNPGNPFTQHTLQRIAPGPLFFGSDMNTASRSSWVYSPEKGRLGYFGESKLRIVQILAGDSFLASIPRYENLDGTVAILVNIPTANHADGDSIDVPWLMEVVGTRKYESVLGAGKTVWVFKAFDLSRFPDVIPQSMLLY